MSDYFIGEIRLFALNYAPQDWHICDGSLLPIQTNAALYVLLGARFGGDNVKTFALPDLRGRTPVHVNYSAGFQSVGTAGGSETVQLAPTQLPAHTHTVNATTNAGTGTNASGNLFGGADGAPPPNLYAPSTGVLQPLNTNTVTSIGGNVGHNNMQPYQVLNYCIALSNGFFPPHQ